LLLERASASTDGFRHTAPGQSAEAAKQARGRQRWVINKLRALNAWYSKGLEGGSQLRVAINSAESIDRLREIVVSFFASPAVVSVVICR
jgi:tRNA-dihydrouridine synthase